MSTSASPTGPDPLRWKALVVLAVAQFMVVLDASIVNVALPSIQRDLDFTDESLQWVVNAYTLAFGGFLLLGGRAADLFGRRRVFIIGLGLFSVASLVGGFATTSEWLILARGVQGLGAAIVAPAALSIVTTTFTEGAERNKALGIWGALAGAGGAVGVLLGGMLTEWAGWEWVLFVNVPIGVAAAVIAPRFVRESHGHEKTSMDIAGATLVTAGLVVLVYALVDAESAGWGSTQTIGLIALSIVLLLGFLWVEGKLVKHPVMPLGIFRNRNVASADSVALLVGASLFSMFFFISLYLQQVLGFSALDAGLAYLPLAFTIIVSAGMASQLVTRVGPKPILVLGLVLTAIGLLLFTQISPDGSFLGDVLVPSIVVAAGLGFSFVPLTITAVAGVTHNEAGLASGLINTAQQVGGALGLAILSSIANSRISHVLGDGPPDPSAVPKAMTEGFQLAFAVGAGFALIGVVIALIAVPRISRDELPQEVAVGA
ncbi:MFS transporter [Conexibacter woesei]|uniref:Drug resistance transporter, EmrB/QacA subfamily n=1 Tax=Conexibacter woesei (strain DSM 14684 / CCUG 47730 / CIP 108061 / JCM 11494 / NBRC 100937 / ID131577) TaxID=469383 RepID=D3FB02_CONWI|nr:MFS transporter [Conexibacter woesei]ADB53194.1 drug resistance transporter, EmrB/QacA subfamily [Conexibacter woesei DSM 14684]